MNAASVRNSYYRPQRAVIDIGSNTVRLVIYGGPRRAPTVWLNEKVTAKLGSDLAATARMPEAAIELTMNGLARFVAILEDLGIDQVQCVATAAVRDAENGLQFVKQAQEMGLDIQVLTGEEEAIASAHGVLGGFPGATGVVADLGGGSLELVAIGDGQCSNAISLPLGTLRLPALQQTGSSGFKKSVKNELERAAFSQSQGAPLYLVGGTWRAFANFAMHEMDYPLSDPQALCLSIEKAEGFAKQITQMTPSHLGKIRGISASRASALPDAASLLLIMLKQLQPDCLIFSSWGLREGLLFRELDALEIGQDPLLNAVTHFSEPRGASLPLATQIAAWTVVAAQSNDGLAQGNERIRLAATMLAMAAIRIEPNMRISHCVDWALHKRWLGLDHRGRAMIAACLRAACGKPNLHSALQELASLSDLQEAASWGLAIRLCRRLGAGSPSSMHNSKLTREQNTLVLQVDPERSQLITNNVESDLAVLAQWLNCDWRVDK